jgi:hypothetical protein
MAAQFEYDVFLSHNQADKPRVRRLAERLRAVGLRVWFDEWVIQPGDDIYLAIERGLEVSRTLVLCLSPAALGSDWVGLERSTVLFRDPSNAGRRFIPLLLADCKLPDTLRRYKYVDFRQEAAAALEELLAACLHPETWPRVSRTGALDAAELQHLRRLLNARRNEWRRLKADFEAQARKYHDLKLSIVYVDGDGPSTDAAFEQPNHVINLWQYYGSGTKARARLASAEFTDFGVTGAELSAFAVVLGKETDLFHRMASRAGSLLPDGVDSVIVENVGKRHGKTSADGAWIIVANKNPLAKWLNFVLMATASSHPDRFTSDTLAVDPFAASLTAFDLFLLTSEDEHT